MRCWRIGRHGLLLGGVGIVVVVVVVDVDVVVAEDERVGVVGRRGHLSPRGRICRQEVACSGSKRVVRWTSRRQRDSEESEERQTVAAFRMRPSAASAPSPTSPASTPSSFALSLPEPAAFSLRAIAVLDTPRSPGRLPPWYPTIPLLPGNPLSFFRTKPNPPNPPIHPSIMPTNNPTGFSISEFKAAASPRSVWAQRDPWARK